MVKLQMLELEKDIILSKLLKNSIIFKSIKKLVLKKRVRPNKSE